MFPELRKLNRSAAPANIPDQIEIDVADFEIGDAKRVRDMKIEGVEFLDIPSNTIVAVKTARAVVEETPVVAATTEGAAAVPGAATGAPGAAPAAGAAQGAAPAAGAAQGAAPAK